MKSLSEFLEVPEGVEFRIYKGSDVYKIENNTLKFKDDSSKEWTDSGLSINNVKKFEITILPKQILTDAEKEYLKAVIKPFKDRIEYITKYTDNYYEHITIFLPGNTPLCFPKFERGKSYKGMKSNNPYKIEELGLEN